MKRAFVATGAVILVASLGVGAFFWRGLTVALSPVVEATLREIEARPRPIGTLHPPQGAFALQPDTSRRALAECKRGAAVVSAELDGPDASAQCLEMVALGVDMMKNGSLTWMLMGSACVSQVAEPCKKAMRATNREQKARALEALTSVRKGVPELGDVMRVDTTVSWLRQCGAALDAASRRRLSPLALSIAGELALQSTSPGLFERFTRTNVCRETQAEVEGWLKVPVAQVPGLMGGTKYDEPRAAAVETLKTLEDMARGP